jgi:hypothetical protein
MWCETWWFAYHQKLTHHLTIVVNHGSLWAVETPIVLH